MQRALIGLFFIYILIDKHNNANIAKGHRRYKWGTEAEGRPCNYGRLKGRRPF